MDAEFWIYIIIGIIYFLSRFFKKGEDPTAEVPQPPRRERARPGTSAPEPTAESPRPLTFEELLREITEGKQAQKRAPEPKPVPVPVPATSYEPYEKDRGDEAQSLEDVTVDEAANVRRWQAYEEVPATHSFERRSLEETLRLEDTVVEFGKFEAFQQREKKKVAEDYIKILRNPESLRQAVVLSEILKRKF